MQETGTTTAERPRSIRALKAGCRVALLSQMDRVSQARVIVRLEELVATRRDVNIAPPDWLGPNSDVLILFSNGDVIAAACLRKVALVDPLIISDVMAKAVAVDMLWQHLAGTLTGMGIPEFVFGIVPGAFVDWEAVVSKEGYAEKLGGERTEFYRKRLMP